MTTMTRFVPLRTPFEDVAGLQKRLNSIFNDFAGPDTSSASFVPAVDVYEDADKLILKLAVQLLWKNSRKSFLLIIKSYSLYKWLFCFTTYRYYVVSCLS